MIGNAAFFAGALASTALLPHTLGSSLRQLEAMNLQAAMQHAPPASCYIEHGFDYPGHDVGNVPGNYDECCVKCASSHLDCTAWTWTDFNGGTCWLKSGRGEIVAKANAKSSLFFPISEAVCDHRPDLDFVGNDLARVNGTTVDTCCDACHKTLGCRAYTWSDYEGGSCWLKSKVTEAVYKAGVKSARAYPDNRAMCFPTEMGGDIPGNDIGSRRSSTPEGCCEICQTVAGCRAYSWTDYQDGTCWLKSKYSTTVRKAGVVSSQVYRD
jgi:hypothetical protein